MTRAEFIRGKRDLLPEHIGDACEAEGYPRPSRQAIARALAHEQGVKRGRPRQTPPKGVCVYPNEVYQTAQYAFRNLGTAPLWVDVAGEAVANASQTPRKPRTVRTKRASKTK
jgi:hypothetical protein